MQLLPRQISYLFGSVLIALALAGCDRSPSASTASTPVHGALIHGDLIAPPPAPASVMAKTPLPVTESTAAPAVTIAPVTFSTIATAAKPAPAPSACVTQPTTRVALLTPDTVKPTPLTQPVVKVDAPAPVPVETRKDGYTTIGFDKLASYNFVVDDAPLPNGAADKANDQIPQRVKALNDEKVSIKGFMLPLKVADGTVTEFLIMKDQSMCCYGTVPKITEWVNVRTTKGVKPIMDQPVSILGTLHVGSLRENGYLVGIYQMDGDKLDTRDN